MIIMPIKFNYYYTMFMTFQISFSKAIDYTYLTKPKDISNN